MENRLQRNQGGAIMRGLVVALMLVLAYTSIRLAQARLKLDKDPLPCFCDVCVVENYPDNGNGISYGTEGK